MSGLALGGAVASAGLPGAPPMPDAPLDRDVFGELVAHLQAERMIPLLAAAVDHRAFPATPAQRDEIEHRHEQAMRLCVLLERSLEEVAGWFARESIPIRVLKGPAVAHLDYADPATRAFGDVDLLVPESRYDDAHAVLGAYGGRRRYREIRTGFDRRFGKGACVVLPDGTEIDLHRTFVAGAFGLTIPLTELFEHHDSVAIGGRDYPALCREQRFVHACYHAALGDAVPRLATLRDVAQLLLATDLDAGRAIEIARRWRGEAVIAHAVKLTWLRLGLGPTDVSRWAFAHQANAYEARAIRAYLGFDRSYARQVATGIRALHGAAAKAAYARTFLLPDRAYLATREGSYARRFRRAARSLSGGGSR